MQSLVVSQETKVLPSVSMALLGPEFCGCWVASGQAGSCIVTGLRNSCVAVSMRGRTYAGQLQARKMTRRCCCFGSWRGGLGWPLSLDTSHETPWQLSRLEVYLLRLQAYLGSSEGSLWG